MFCIQHYAFNVLDGGKPQFIKPNATDHNPHGQENVGTNAPVASGGGKPNQSSSNAADQNLSQQENTGMCVSAVSGEDQPNTNSNGKKVRDYIVTC